MARNGSGTYAVPNSFTPSTTISSAAVNSNFSDAGDEITNSVAADGQTTITGALKGANGSAATPSYGFASDTNTGMYRKGADSLGFATAGSERAYLDSAGKLFALGDADIAGDLNLQGALTGVSDILSIAGVAANAAAIRLAEDTDNGSNTVTIRAAASISSNIEFTLPSADGDAGDALVTDGSGALSFGNLAPIGSAKIWFTATPPAGWLECDGAAVSRTTYSALFAVISDDYGPGNGTTTFNLPDLRGEFLRGFDNGAGNDPDAASRTDRGDGTTGDNVGTKQADAFEAHNHTISGGFKSDSSSSDGDDFFMRDGTTTPDGMYSDTDDIENAGGNETRPRNVAVMFIIRAL